MKLPDSLDQALSQVDLHQHLCLIYESLAEQFATVIPYIRFGLERGERCIYIADENSPATVLAALQTAGIDVEAALAAEALQVLTKHDTYLRDGCFDPDRMIAFVAAAVKKARAAGFRGLRSTGEMTWFLDGGTGAEQMLEYEARLNYLLPEQPVTLLCQYNRWRFSPEIISGLLHTHPFIIYSGHLCRNFYYVPPEEYLQRNRDDLQVQRQLNNIVDRKRLVDDLQASEARYRLLFEQANDAIFLETETDEIVDVNWRACELLGYSRAELLAMKVSDLQAPECRVPGLVIRSELERGGGPFTTIDLHQDGRRIPVEVTVARLTGRGEGLVLSIVRDITGHIQVEQALERRNRELAMLNLAAQVFILTLDLDQMLLVILEEVRLLMEVSTATAWLVEPASGELVCRQSVGLQAETARGWRLAAGDGVAGWVSCHNQSQIVTDSRIDPRYASSIDSAAGLEMRSILSAPLRVNRGGQVQVAGVLQTLDTAPGRFGEDDRLLLESLAATAAIAVENARLYEQATQDAETKAMLLQEVNHRVKNNLASIMGLISLEQRHAPVTDPATYQSVMQDLQSRVRGLAAVHSLLSASDWSPLLLSDLADRVIGSVFQALPAHKQAAIQVLPSPARVSPKQANSLALVFNELATNTLKYAFRDNAVIHITVRIESQNGLTRVEFRDDGPGFPAGVLAGTHTNVGLQLIKNLVCSEPQGSLSLANGGGAVVEMFFKLNHS